MQRVLRDAGPSFTNNGLALSPDHKSIYATWIGNPSLIIKRVSMTTGRVRTVVAGVLPEVSRNGRYLAYARMRRPSVFVRDLRTGRTRSWSLRGSTPECIQVTSVAWLGDGSRLAIRPDQCPVAGTGGDTTSPSPQPGPPALLTIDPARRGSRPHRISVPFDGSQISAIYSGGSAAPHALLVDCFGNGGDTIYRLALGAAGPRVTAQVTLSHALLLAVDSSGRQLLYVHSSHDPDIRRATLTGDHLTGVRRLSAAPSLEAAVW